MTEYEVKCSQTWAWYTGYVHDYNEQEGKLWIQYPDDWKEGEWLDVSDVRYKYPNNDTTWRPTFIEDAECKARAEEGEPCGWWPCKTNKYEGTEKNIDDTNKYKENLVVVENELYNVAFAGWGDQHNEILGIEYIRKKSSSLLLSHIKNLYKQTYSVPPELKEWVLTLCNYGIILEASMPDKNISSKIIHTTYLEKTNKLLLIGAKRVLTAMKDIIFPFFEKQKASLKLEDRIQEIKRKKETELELREVYDNIAFLLFTEWPHPINTNDLYQKYFDHFRVPMEINDEQIEDNDKQWIKKIRDGTRNDYWQLCDIIGFFNKYYRFDNKMYIRKKIREKICECMDALHPYGLKSEEFGKMFEDCIGIKTDENKSVVNDIIALDFKEITDDNNTKYLVKKCTHHQLILNGKISYYVKKWKRYSLYSISVFHRMLLILSESNCDKMNIDRLLSIHKNYFGSDLNMNLYFSRSELTKLIDMNVYKNETLLQLSKEQRASDQNKGWIKWWRAMRPQNTNNNMHSNINNNNNHPIRDPEPYPQSNNNNPNRYQRLQSNNNYLADTPKYGTHNSNKKELVSQKPYILSDSDSDYTNVPKSNQSEIITALKQIGEQMKFFGNRINQQQKQLNAIEQLIIQREHTKRDSKKNNNFEPKLIDGYLRECNHFDDYIARCIKYYYPQMTDAELTAALNDKQHEVQSSKIEQPHNTNTPNNNDVRLWEKIKQKRMNRKHMNVKNESMYLMIQNVGIDIRNKQFTEIKEYILSFLFDIGIELDDIYKNDKNQFELKYDTQKAHLYVQLKMCGSQSVQEAISKGEKYVNLNGQNKIAKKWKVRQWCNYGNRVTRKTLKNKKIRNNNQQKQNSNQMNNNISGVLPFNYNYSLPVMTNSGQTYPNYTLPLPIYYNNTL